MMINKEDFSDIYSKEVIERIISKNPKPFYYKDVYRLIKHPKNKGLNEDVFLPTIMEINGNTMPPFEKQNRKTNLGLFSVSVYDSLEHIMLYFSSITSMREPLERGEYCLAKGKVHNKKGFGDKASESGDKIGHINYYLYDPINNNPVNDFELEDNCND